MEDIQKSIEFSRQIRKVALRLVYESKASHIGGALSMADILAVLYDDILSFNPTNPDGPSRDRFLLSKGHACASLYAALAIKGFYSLEDLNTYGKDGSIFLSHASHKVPGVEFSTGSLGHALPVACGMALAAKKRNERWKTMVLMSDGELDEGSNWEAILFAPNHGLNNLSIIIDYNKIQSFGSVNDVMALEPLRAKIEAFGWHVHEVDGHDHLDLLQTFRKLPFHPHKPSAVIAHTVKGKGVDFMEGQLLWHYKSPSKEQLEAALNQI